MTDLWYAPERRAPDLRAVHALVIGVSRYPNRPFDLGDLPGAATSAYAFARWLVAGFRPPNAQVAGIRLLTAREPDDQRPVIEPTAAAVQAALDAWLHDCAEDGGIPICAVIGHGLQEGPGQGVVLLADAQGSSTGTFRAALDVRKTLAGLRGNPALSPQWWFVDACRTPSSQLSEFTGVISARIGFDTDGRPPSNVYLAHAASPGQPTHSDRRGTAFFRALLDSLALDALLPPDDPDADPSWTVTWASLYRALKIRTPWRARQLERHQIPELDDGSRGDPNVVLTVAGPPEVPFTVVVDDPAELVDRTPWGAAVLDDREDPVLSWRVLPVSEEPVTGGEWRLHVTPLDDTVASYTCRPRTIHVTPRRRSATVRLERGRP